MACFDSGVKGYIKGVSVVEVNFPIDWRGSAEIACKHCQFYDRSKQMCWLNKMVVNFPDKYVGENCPLEKIEEGDNE